MESTGRIEQIGDWLWFVAWGIASSVWCVTAAAQLGATFDEPVYVLRGLEGWHTGSHSGLLRLGTMPLPVDVTTLPLYFYERWHGITLSPLEDLDQMLPLARAGTLLFWWLLLLYGRQVARSLGGPWAGRLAVALLAVEPSLLAHASLATTDIAVTACLLALTYHFRAGRERGWLLRIGIPAGWFAATLLAKASGLVFGTICLLVIELERLVRAGALHAILKGSFRDRLHVLLALAQPLRRDLTQIVGLGLVLSFLYCGCDWRQEASFVAWAHSLPQGPVGDSMVWLAEHLRIFRNAGEAIVRQVTHNIRGHGAFLLGRSDPRAIWYYFPVVLSIKLSVPVLLAPLVVLLLRPRSLLNWSCLAAAALLVFSLNCRVQLGIRLMLPLVVLAVAGLSASLVETVRVSATPWRRRWIAGCVAGGILWTAWSAANCWPNGLCYVNSLWGGTQEGYRRVSETNYDWGQGVPELARWQQLHGMPELAVWYFGTDPMIGHMPVTILPLHEYQYRGPDDVLHRVRGHRLAVSTSLLYGMVVDSESTRQAVAFLRTQQPVDRTMTFLIFDFSAQPPNASPNPDGQTTK